VWCLKTTEGFRPHPMLAHLLRVIPAQASLNAWSLETTLVYRSAAQELSHGFSRAEALGKFFTTWHALSLWPMKVSQEYMTLLKARHPGALVLMAHYCYLLQKLDGCWYFEGKAKRMLSVIVDCLEERWHLFLGLIAEPQVRDPLCKI